MTVALHVGSYPSLVHARGLLLRHLGFAVVNAYSGPEAEQAFLLGDFDLVVLCHSLPEEERRSLTALVHRRSPSVPVVLVQFGGDPAPFEDAVVEGDPTKLSTTLPGLAAQPRRVPPAAPSS